MLCSVWIVLISPITCSELRVVDSSLHVTVTSCYVAQYSSVLAFRGLRAGGHCLLLGPRNNRGALCARLESPPKYSDRLARIFLLRPEEVVVVVVVVVE